MKRKKTQPLSYPEFILFVMSRSLRDSAERSFQKALQLAQKSQFEEALKELEKAEEAVNTLLKYAENEFIQESFQMNLKNVFTLGTLFYNMGRFPQAKKCCELQILIFQKLLEKDPKNTEYQSEVAMTLNNLSILLSNMGRIEEAKERYEKALEMKQKLLNNDPENVVYQSSVAMTLNNLGNLLSDMGRIDDAKERYEKALEMRQKLLETDPENVAYQSDVGGTLNNLGLLLSNMGRIDDAKGRYEKALEMYEKLLETDPENMTYQSNVGTTLNNLGLLLSDMGRIDDAKERYEKALEMYEKLLETDPENVAYQSDVAMTLNNLGLLLSDMGRIEEAKERYEKALEMSQKLLETDPENVAYQSDVAMTLNNLGNLLSDMGRIEEAKERYKETLGIFTEPMQYLTIGKKSQAIIRVIELNLDLAEEETNYRKQMDYLEESYQLCKENQEFFITYGLRHERKLVMEAGFSAYVDYMMKDIRWEKDSKKRAIGYEKAIKAIEKLGKTGDDEEVEKIASSTVCYLEGRKLVNEALASEQPDLELIKQAANQFKDAKETYKKANICYCIYIGLLKILENIEIFEEGNGSKAKDMIQQVIEILPEKIDPGIRAAFEEIARIFDEKDTKSRKKHLKEFDEKIRAIEYKALENLFGHVQKKLKDYIEEPFSPNLFYNNWKLRITFDAEKIKGKLTVKTGNTILFDQMLSREEIKDNEIEIDYLERKYIPEGKDVIIFETPNQKQVFRDIDYSETISNNKKARIFLHNCCNSVCAGGDLKIAVVQLRYDVYGEDYTVKILESEAYKRKVITTLETVKGEVNVVVFPEFSIPFDYLEEIQRYSNENGIIVFAGTHYITEENLEKYEKLFASDFTEEDFRKNICPIVIPNSKIMHNEKMFGAKEERALFFHKGMKQGKINHIFKLRDNLNIGVLICFEFLNDELRQRLISTCDVILVPQTNPGPARFYYTAKNDLNNPLCAGNKACIMANGIFRIGKMKKDKFESEKKEIDGGSTGVLLTLDKDSNKMQDEEIISRIKDQKEQFILLATINTQYSAARDIPTAPEPIKTSLIHIFEENEIRLIKKENITKENTEEFLALIGNINACKDRKDLKNLIEKNRNLIEKYSSLMHESTENLNNLDLEEIKEKCRCVLVPAN
ncbi:MAG: tetratricopeptide repeat protein [Methanosarcina sp.]